MTSPRMVASAALVFATALTAHALVPQGAPPATQPPSSAVPPAGERGQAPPAGPGQGRGGGRGNPAASLYTERCAGCHGVDMGGGRAPSLFDDVWARGSEDEAIARNIMNGIPNTEMMPFKEQLTEQQIWQLVAYLKTQGANLKTKPTYVPDPDGQVIKTEKETFKVEIVARGLETPWGLAFLPDGRLLITERPGRLRIVQKGQLLPEPVTGTPTVWERQDGGLFDVEVHPQYAKNGWIYLAYSEPGPNNTAPPSAAAAAAAGLLQGRGGGQGGGAPNTGAVGAGAPQSGTVGAGAPPAGAVGAARLLRAVGAGAPQSGTVGAGAPPAGTPARVPRRPVPGPIRLRGRRPVLLRPTRRTRSSFAGRSTRRTSGSTSRSSSARSQSSTPPATRTSARGSSSIAKGISSSRLASAGR